MLRVAKYDVVTTVSISIVSVDLWILVVYYLVQERRWRQAGSSETSTNRNASRSSQFNEGQKYNVYIYIIEWTYRIVLFTPCKVQHGSFWWRSSCMGEGRGVHKVLVGKPEGKRPLGRPRRRWDDNIKIDLEEVGRGCGDWTELVQDRDRWRALVSTVMNFRVP